MRQLDRKLLRDLWRLRSQVIAIALVVGCGIAMFVMSLSARILPGAQSPAIL